MAAILIISVLVPSLGYGGFDSRYAKTLP